MPSTQNMKIRATNIMRDNLNMAPKDISCVYSRQMTLVCLRNDFHHFRRLNPVLRPSLLLPVRGNPENCLIFMDKCLWIWKVIWLSRLTRKRNAC